jgi:drug/metabolite transporter (DMT)-like permease
MVNLLLYKEGTMTTSTDNARKLQNRAVLGVLLMIGGLALYALSDAFIKQLMGTYSVPQTSFLRAFTRLVPLLFAVFMQGGVKKIFATQYPSRHLVRLGVNLAYTYSFMYAFSVASLTTIYTLSYTSSFFMILLSALILKERIGKEKWIAVAIGMIGVIIAIRPGSNVFELAAIVVFFWVTMLDFFWWEKTPTLSTIIGAAVIVGSNLYILYRSRKEQLEQNRSPKPA